MILWKAAVAMMPALLAVGMDPASADTARVIEFRTATKSRVYLASPLFTITTLSMNADGLYAGGSHLFLMRPDATVAWAFAPNCRMEEIRALPGGGAVALARSCGIFGLPQNDRTPKAENPILLRLTTDGDLLWARQIRDPVLTLTDAAIGRDGSIYVAGYSARPNQRSYSNARLLWQDTLVMKVDPDGNLLWARQVWTEDGDEAVGLAIGNDQHPIVLGYGGHLAKIDGAGELIWSRQLQEDSAWPMTALGIAPSGDGTIVGGRTVSPGRSGTDAFAIVVDGAGTVNRAEVIDSGPSDRIEQVLSDGEGGALLVGSTRRVGPTLEDKVHRMDGWLVRVDRTGAVTGSVTMGGDFEDYLNDAAADSRIAAAGNLELQRDDDVPMIVYEPFGVSGDACSEVSALPAATMAMSVSMVEVPTEMRDIEVRMGPVDISLAPAEVEATIRCNTQD